MADEVPKPLLAYRSPVANKTPEKKTKLTPKYEEKKDSGFLSFNTNTSKLSSSSSTKSDLSVLRLSSDTQASTSSSCFSSPKFNPISSKLKSSPFLHFREPTTDLSSQSSAFSPIKPIRTHRKACRKLNLDIDPDLEDQKYELIDHIEKLPKHIIDKILSYIPGKQIREIAALNSFWHAFVKGTRSARSKVSDYCFTIPDRRENMNLSKLGVFTSPLRPTRFSAVPSISTPILKNESKNREVFSNYKSPQKNVLSSPHLRSSVKLSPQSSHRKRVIAGLKPEEKCCMCPKCSFAAIQRTESVGFCIRCDFKFCVECKDEYHGGASCYESLTVDSTPKSKPRKRVSKRISRIL